MFCDVGKAWVQCTGALDPLRCCHVSSIIQFLYMWQYLNGSGVPVHWNQAVPLWCCLLLYYIKLSLTFLPKFHSVGRLVGMAKLADWWKALQTQMLTCLVACFENNFLIPCLINKSSSIYQNKTKQKNFDLNPKNRGFPLWCMLFGSLFVF